MSKSRKFLGRTSITICDNKWDVYFHNDNQYERLGVTGSRACTVAGGKHRSIHFNVDLCYSGDGVVVHELVHAFTKELMGHDLPLGPEKREEFFCVLFEMRGERILKLAKPLTKTLLKYVKKSVKAARGK